MTPWPHPSWSAHYLKVLYIFRWFTVFGTGQSNESALLRRYSWIRGCERWTKMNRRKRSVTIYVRNKQRYNPASKLYNFINVRVENFAGTKIGDIKEVCMRLQKKSASFTPEVELFTNKKHMSLSCFRRPDDSREIMRKLMTYTWITRDWRMIGNTPCSVSTNIFCLCVFINWS